MNLEYRELSRVERGSRWLSHRLSGTYAQDTRYWKYAVVALWALSCMAVAIASLGMPTGLGSLFDVVTAISVNTIAAALSAALLASLLAIVGLRVPRFTAGTFLYTGGLLFAVFYYSEFGIIGSLIYCFICALLFGSMGLLAGWLADHWGRRGVQAGTLILAGVIMLSIGYAAWGSPVAWPSLSHSDEDHAAADQGEVNTAAVLPGNPSKPGIFSYAYYTYGSGKDKHRKEYGEQVDLRANTVDASAYIDNWPWLREKFWGFDETELPLNGRVWMPEGEGPFPLLLMVHGNHLMEKFSDEGYGYLGELLASQGTAVVSIDENFLNYSVWSGIPKKDMLPRAWLLLKHIQELQKLNVQEGSPLYKKIDFQQLALLGHSRGGQAAAMAVDRERWFAEDTALPEEASYRIQGVIALAPTDKVVDNKHTELEDVSYLTLQGAKDSDLVNFYGNRQYGRVSFSSSSPSFKASVYIEDANHSQFNTEWGSTDHSFPAGLFIRPKAKLAATEQRQIAKLYVAAFLETVFHESDRYEKLFRDYRSGAHLLPVTRYYSQYENGTMKRIADFEEDDRSILLEGAVAVADNLTKWQHEEALLRQGQGKGNRGLSLMWEEEGSYTIDLSDSEIELSGGDSFLFSMAVLPEADQTAPSAADSDFSVEVEIVDEGGISVLLPLEEFMPIEPPPETDFTWLPAMEAVIADGKFKASQEAIYQTYELPLSQFEEVEASFNAEKISEITFHFSGDAKEIMLDDLGFIVG